MLFNLDYYLKYPIEILEVWNGGLAIHGALIGGIISIFVYCYKHKINVLKITDAAAVAIILSQSIGRWGNFFNSEAHGTVTTLANLKKLMIPNFIIKGMYIDGEYFLPTFLFESIWDLLGFIILFFTYKKYKKLRLGQLTGIYFMWYSFGRFFIEILRTDSLMISNVALVFLIMIILMLTLFIIYKKYRLINKKKYYYLNIFILVIGIFISVLFSKNIGTIRVACFVSLVLFGIGFLILLYNSKDTRLKRLEMRK